MLHRELNTSSDPRLLGTHSVPAGWPHASIRTIPIANAKPDAHNGDDSRIISTNGSRR
jgi:hypothetical protein